MPQRALAETSLPLSDIALKMGYSELSAFTRAFTRLTGTPPLTYRRTSETPLVRALRAALNGAAVP